MGYKPKQYQKFLAAGVASAVAASASPAFAAEQEGLFTDISIDMDGYNEIEFLTENGILNGYTDGTFRPNEFISRGQAAKIIARALDLEVPEDRGDYLFNDITESMKDQELVNAIAAVSAEGIFTGKIDGTFRPAEKMTRQQMAKVLYIAFGLEYYGGKQEIEFNDKGNISRDLSEYVDKMAELGITIGRDGSFLPLSQTSRKQFSQFVYRAFHFESHPSVTEVELYQGDEPIDSYSASDFKELTISSETLNSADELVVWTNGVAEGIEILIETRIGEVLVQEEKTSEQQNFISINLNELREKHGGILPAGNYDFTVKSITTAGQELVYKAKVNLVNSPFIKGVANGAYYNSAVSPFTEDSYSEAVLTLNGKEQETFELGDTLDTDGSYQITLRGKDGETNTSSFILDKTKPEVTVEGLTDLEYYYGEDVNFTISANDLHLKDLDVLLNGEKIDAASGYSIAADGQNDGDYNLEYVATDEAGNVTSDQIEFSVDSSTAYAENAEELISAVNDGAVDSVFLAEDIVLANTLNISRKVSINGNSHILAISSEGYGINAREIDHLSIEDIIIDASDVDSYGLKLEDLQNLNLTNVTVKGAEKSAIDLNGVTNATLSNVGAEDTERGAGLALTNSTGIVIDGFTGVNNSWGGIGVFTGSELVLRGSNSFEEPSADLYTDHFSSVTIGLSESNLKYKVSVPSNPELVLYFETEADAADAAAIIGENAKAEAI
ncbi:S-layer homology domain-containing protein [Bacillus infantis]|uniref:S-layer homology domain-containing protein n=1 Tax=Bacillus infantis TaxID=324767 RepID=UPI003CF8C22B